MKHSSFCLTFYFLTRPCVLSATRIFLFFFFFICAREFNPWNEFWQLLGVGLSASVAASSAQSGCSIRTKAVLRVDTATSCLDKSLLNV